MRLLRPILLACVSLVPAFSADAPRQPPQSPEEQVDRLLDRIVAAEKDFLARFADYQPVMETYLQGTDETSGKDHYLLGRMALGSEGIDWVTYVASAAFFPDSKPGFWPKRAKGLLPRGFAQMAVPDAFDFNRETYEFSFRRREFVGDVRTLVFDVRPRTDEEGKFVGRIWVEDRGCRIVRFNGTYTRKRKKDVFFHFDSWRVNVDGDLWVPAYIYIQDEDETGVVGAHFEGQSRIWNYRPKRGDAMDELTAILVEDDQVEDLSQQAEPSPLEAERQWRKQAQQNVLDRLEQAGLLAPRGAVDEVLNAVVNNLLAASGSAVHVECRVLLTTPLETFSIGEAIVISRGLIDVLPDEASLAMALSGELAHILLGHRMDAMLGFGDSTIIEDAEVLAKLRLARPEDEIQSAGAKALELLQASPYADKLANAGLFLKALESRSAALPNLVDSNFGNGLATPNGVARLGELAASAPELRENALDQIAALPLGSRVHLDPWTNEIQLREVKPVELRTADDKLPFEVTPFLIPLRRKQGP